MHAQGRERRRRKRRRKRRRRGEEEEEEGGIMGIIHVECAISDNYNS